MRQSSPSSRPAVRKELANELRQREYVLAVQHGSQHSTLNSFVVGENVFLMAARAEVARLAGEGEQQDVTALRTADAREAAVQIAAFEKTAGHILFDGAAYAAGLITVGMTRGLPPLRYFAIVLFGITVAKVLAVDLDTLGGIYRILAFMAVGVVLLFASFLYQRRKTG